MTEQFQVGNLMILQNGTVFPEYNGFLAVVLESGRYRRAMNMLSMEREGHFLYKVKVIKELDALSVNNGKLCVRPCRSGRSETLIAKNWRVALWKPSPTLNISN